MSFPLISSPLSEPLQQVYIHYWTLMIWIVWKRHFSESCYKVISWCHISSNTHVFHTALLHTTEPYRDLLHSYSWKHPHHFPSLIIKCPWTAIFQPPWLVDLKGNNKIRHNDEKEGAITFAWRRQLPKPSNKLAADLCDFFSFQIFSMWKEITARCLFIAKARLACYITPSDAVLLCLYTTRASPGGRIALH